MLTFLYKYYFNQYFYIYLYQDTKSKKSIKMATRKTALDSAVSTVKPPITFKEFSKDPVKGLLFIVLIAIGYLYVDIKLSNKEIVSKQDAKIEALEGKVTVLVDQLRKSDSTSASLASKISVLQELGKIK
jgi:hypothetical protein